MKLSKSLALAALFAISGATLASATTTEIYITGSTAYRGSVVTAIANVLHLQGGSGVVTAAYVGSSVTGANQSIIFGPVVGGNQTVVNCSWSGSVGGLQTLTASTPLITNYMDLATYSSSATALTLGGGATAATGGLAVTGPTLEAATKPDVAMSDVFKRSTPYNLGTVTENTVGIVPFKFVASVGAPAGLTNMTPQLAQSLFKGGTTPLALFTGNSADETTTVYALGRDNDSGTRLTAFAETGVGVFTVVAQYYPYDSSANASANTTTGVVGLSGSGSTINAVNIVPASTVNGTPLVAGNGGYASGGNLATAMKAANAITPAAYFVTYLGFSDAASALSGGAKELTYNGVPFSVTAIEEGQYTFWGYEHLDYLTSLATAKKTFATSVKTQLVGGDDQLSGALVTSAAMRVSRSSDGALVSPLY